jgi:hypothetical protein
LGVVALQFAHIKVEVTGVLSSAAVLRVEEGDVLPSPVARARPVRFYRLQGRRTGPCGDTTRLFRLFENLESWLHLLCDVGVVFELRVVYPTTADFDAHQN